MQQSYERKERCCAVGSQEKLLCVLSREGCDKWGCFEPARVSLLMRGQAAEVLSTSGAALAGILAGGATVFIPGGAPKAHWVCHGG